MKTYSLIFLALFLAKTFAYSQSSSANSKPQYIDVKKVENSSSSSIVWINPDIDAKVSDQNKFIVKAGVISSEKLKSVKLFVNGVEEPSIRGYEIGPGDRPMFNEIVDKVVVLNRKNNEIKIVAEAESGIVLSDKKMVQLKGMPEDKAEVKSMAPETSASAAKLTAQLGIKKNYALLIGVQEYADMSLNTLTTPITDVQDVMEVLTSNYTFEKENITVLTNPQWADIVKAFDKLATFITPGDNLLIFYSGHGFWDKQTKKGYWLPSNAKKSDKFDWYSNADLKDHIAAINSRHTLLVSDAAFFGSVLKLKEAFTKKATPEAEMDRFKLASRHAMTSGSFVTVPDKSIFIKYFLKGLKENQASYISAEQLFINFKSGVQNNGPNGQIPRFGEITETGDAGGDFVFIKK